MYLYKWCKDSCRFQDIWIILGMFDFSDFHTWCPLALPCLVRAQGKRQSLVRMPRFIREAWLRLVDSRRDNLHAEWGPSTAPGIWRGHGLRMFEGCFSGLLQSWPFNQPLPKVLPTEIKVNYLVQSLYLALIWRYLKMDSWLSGRNGYHQSIVLGFFEHRCHSLAITGIFWYLLLGSFPAYIQLCLAMIVQYPANPGHFLWRVLFSNGLFGCQNISRYFPWNWKNAEGPSTNPSQMHPRNIGRIGLIKGQ